MSALRIEKVTALPVVLSANTMYVVKALLSNLVEIFFTNADGSVLHSLAGLSESNATIVIESALRQFIGQPNGVAGLDANGFITPALLSDSGVTAGTYNQITVDTKGRVTSGNNNASQTFNMEFANISSLMVALDTVDKKTVDQFPVVQYRVARYSVQSTWNNDFEFTELIVMSDGVNSYITEFETICNNSPLVSFEADIWEGNVRLLGTPAHSGTVSKMVRTAIVI